MGVRIKFLGGALTVTGSKYLIELKDYKLLIDCGLFQGLKNLRERNWDDFPVDVAEINDIIISHAHIDHSGYLPRLVKQGFDGRIFCTEATADLLKIMLLDSARLQEEEADYARKKGYSKHQPPLPLYTTEDAQLVFPKLQSFSFNRIIKLTNGIQLEFHEAGHILGAAIVKLTFKGKWKQKSLVFSGDLGRDYDPLLRPPSCLKEADVLLIESTYGNKGNPTTKTIETLKEMTQKAISRGGCLLIPAFSLGRTQNLLYHFVQLIENKELPLIPIYVDSPMAISITGLYKKHHKYHKLEALGENGVGLFDKPYIHYYSSQEESSSLNNLKKNAIIISASGMCSGGRILHHLYNRLSREDDTILFVGYQAEGTRGRDILEGEEQIKVFGEWIARKCNVAYINGLSAHADKIELINWLSCFEKEPEKTFLVHGEDKVIQEYQKDIKEKLGWKHVLVPQYLESFVLFKDI